MRPLWAKGVVLVAAATLLLAGCGADGSSPINPGASNGVFSIKATPGGTLTAAFSGNIRTLDPARLDDATSALPMEAIYQTLVGYNAAGTKIVPEAATFSVSKSGLVYTFHIKANERFSNGDPVTAADVKYSLDRITSSDGAGNKPAPFSGVYANIVGYQAWHAGDGGPAEAKAGLSGVKVLGKQKLTITLQAPEAYFLKTLAMMSAAILDPKVVAAHPGKAYSANAIGSGPFALQSWNPGHDMVLAANPHFGGQKPKLKKLVFDGNMPENVQLARFEKGQIDVLLGPLSNATYAQIQADPVLKKLYHKIPENGIVYLAFNTTKPPFNNVHVRLAVNYALDKQSISEQVTGGRGVVASQPLPPTMEGYNTSVKPYPYNVTAAQEELKLAGYKSGKGPAITFVYPSNTPATTKTAQLVQQQLEAAGFTVKATGISTLSQYWSVEDNPDGSWNLAWTDWSQDYPDPHDFMANLLSKNAFHSTNVGDWTNKAFQKLITTAATLPATEDGHRIKLYEQAETIAHNSAAWAFLYYYWDDALVQPWVGPADPSVFLNRVTMPQFGLMWTNHVK